MNRLFSQLIVLLLAASWLLPAQAVRLGPSMNSAEWKLELSPFECKMWQPVPYFGDAVFSNRAGEEQKFFLAPTRKAMRAGEARLVSTAPVWDETRRSLDMGVVAVRETKPSIMLVKGVPISY